MCRSLCKTVEVPLVPFVDMVIVVLVVLHREVPMIQKVQKFIEVF